MNFAPQDLLSDQTAHGTFQAKPSEPIFSLDIPGRLPSWNEILGMEQWRRYQFKKELADRFLSSLRASAADCSTKTTLPRSTMLTFAATLEFYLVTQQAKRKLKSARKRLEQKNRSSSELKFSKPDLVPF